MGYLDWEPMSPRSRPETAARHALWVGGLLVILGGLFGMHGMDSHGAGSMETSGHAAMTSPAANAVTAGHEVMSATAHEAAPVVDAGVVATGHAAKDMGGVGMCMAILGVALIVLSLLLRSSRARPLLWVFPRPARALGFCGRDPDPPSLIYLSIRRC